MPGWMETSVLFRHDSARRLLSRPQSVHAFDRHGLRSRWHKGYRIKPRTDCREYRQGLRQHRQQVPLGGLDNVKAPTTSISTRQCAVWSPPHAAPCSTLLRHYTTRVLQPKPVLGGFRKNDPGKRKETEEYIAQRYARATEVMNLMVEKMPEYTSPYGIQIGYQIADLFGRLELLSQATSSFPTKPLAIAKHGLTSTSNICFISRVCRLPNSVADTRRPIYIRYILHAARAAICIARSRCEETIKELAAQGVDFNRYYRNHNEG